MFKCAYLLTVIIVAVASIFAIAVETNSQPVERKIQGAQTNPSPGMSSKAARLIAAYPDHLDRIDGNSLVWKDGTRMPFDDGVKNKEFNTLLNTPDIEDQFSYQYKLGAMAGEPPLNVDPGRIRNDQFFTKMYGDCKASGLKMKLAPVQWMPKRRGGTLMVTTINGINKKLEAVVGELEKLPGQFTKYLVPSAGVFNCREIAGTKRRSVHAFGAAIDINYEQSDYWRNAKSDANKRYRYRNKIPIEIVKIFERHGFIWGGKWYHFDTMHFEYRPELTNHP